MRLSTKERQCPIEYQDKAERLKLLATMHILGLIRLVFGDETGFTMSPYVPYAWQKKGERILLPAKNNKKRLNVLGFLDPENRLKVFYQEKSLNGEFVANAIDDFANEKNDIPVVIILDNAPIHRCATVYDKMEDWEDKNLFIFFLPRYSPHLNRIEILWKHVKYRWLKKKHYSSWSRLVKMIKSIFKNFATIYTINFKELNTT